MRPILLFLLALTLCSCATEWQRDHQGLNLQRSRISTFTAHKAHYIQTHELQAGDILFSAERSAISLGVRLFNNASVSHAFIYLGNGQIAEAVGAGVRIRSLDAALKESTLTVAFRRDDLSDDDIAQLRQFAQQHSGKGYNYIGIAKQTPYSIVRNVCELPIIPRHIRRLCLNSVSTILITPFAGEGFFCSQFVIESFNHIKKPLTTARPEAVTPLDILHLRHGDVASVKASAHLHYVGHLQCANSPWNTGCERLNSQ